MAMVAVEVDTDNNITISLHQARGPCPLLAVVCLRVDNVASLSQLLIGY